MSHSKSVAVDFRVRNRISDAELESKKGKILTDADHNVRLVGPARVWTPTGSLLCVYLPGVLADVDPATRATLSSLKAHTTNNRGLASGTKRVDRGGGKRSDARAISSAVIGSMDPAGPKQFCRLTAWTGEHADEFSGLVPLLQRIADHLQREVPDRFAAQAAEARRVNPAWVIRGTPFTTVTVNNCVDPATECLTRRGWTSYVDLRPGDELLAYDPESHTTRWEPVSDVFVNEHYAGDMVWLSSRGFTAFTTPDHRWPLRPQSRPGFTVKLSRDLPTSHYWQLLRNAPHSAPERETVSDEFVRLIAWYFTEGSLLRAGTSVSICQSEIANPVNVEDIRRDLKTLGFRPWREWRERSCSEASCDEPAVTRDLCNRHSGQRRYRQRKQGIVPAVRAGRSRRVGLWVNETTDVDGKVTWVLTGDGLRELLDACPGRDKVPSMSFLCSLTARQASLFVDTCILGDGSPERRSFWQYHQGRMDAFCVAAVLAGFGPALDHTGTHCALRECEGVGLQSVKRETLYYEGPVWCPRVPSGHWVARRDGKVHLTGNTYPTGVHTDKGDLDKGFSTIAAFRSGHFTGGVLTFPRYRVAVDLQDGDLILMDAHEWHGNTMITCPHSFRSDAVRDCPTCRGERISVVSYFRTGVTKCGTVDQEAGKARRYAEKTMARGEIPDAAKVESAGNSG